MTIKKQETKLNRNEARRKKYKEDPEYREKVKKRARESYVKSTYVPESTRVGDHTSVRENMGGGCELCVSRSQMADILGVTPQWLSRKVKDGLIPDAKLVVKEEVQGSFKGTRTIEIEVYTVEEAAALKRVFDEHRRVYSYFTRKCRSTIQAIRDEFKVLRG